MIDAKSPCTAQVVPGKKGGLRVELTVPTYSGGVTLSLAAERDRDGDWVVYIPWVDDDGLDSDGLGRLTNGVGVANGIVYLGAPDISSRLDPS